MLAFKALQTEEIGAAKSDGCKTKVRLSLATQAMLANHSVQINSSLLKKAWKKYDSVNENNWFNDFYLTTITITNPLLSYDCQMFTTRK